ncbi:Curli production assembly/transport component CsgG [Croceitalea dokdonensis DOKDO 023]|uniref:Curli production assembly/transport component CsgG n=1 Tax=Croceitalea dokdonensis DOKDO 023 TaxID=1300341 RepID=A0A0N8H3R0_9FLAO|nr:FlgO family outer membrane protein [Croceitalea dokdonensis]KPM31268.1 Curli production assembly/transport component CsgG [Croceitalea dokdonensis DOKDO 023]
MKFSNVCILSLLFIASHSLGQDFDSQLEQLAAGLSKKIESKGKTKVAVWGFFTENGEKTALGNYITEDFSVYLTNFGNKFEVIDRNHLNVLLKEHQLNSEGYIDENTAKELGKIVAVDVIITGTYTVLNSVVKVRAKALDTETALQFAASMGNLALNENIASYLGVSVNGGNSTNRGFNSQLSSNETVNNPETVDENCKKTSTGDVCFANSSSQKIIIGIYYFPSKNVQLYSRRRKTVILESKETKCIYQVGNEPLTFFISNWNVFVDEEKFNGSERNLYSTRYAQYLKDKGELKVETCKSKTYTIK